MVTRRKKFQGVLNILSFNRHFYVIGICVWLLISISGYFIEWPGQWLFVIQCGFLYGLIAPLIVSAYVYDFSGYYDMHWLEHLPFPEAPIQRIANINAGFDETSFLLQDRFKSARIEVFDFYDQSRHTEPAIIRARKVSNVFPGTKQISTTLIPIEDGVLDIVFVLSAAHEIRSNKEKTVFLKECRRVCKPDGVVVVVEHLRDVPNFLAFTVGFTHFFSSQTWRKCFKEAKFSKYQEEKFTSFMSIFICKP